MNTDELNQIRSIIKNIRDRDVSVMFSKEFPDTDLSQKLFYNYSASEFINLTNRIIEQLEVELQTDSSRFWPRSFYWHVIQGSVNHDLIKVLTNFDASIVANQWEQAGQLLELLIGFQITCGFWDRGARKLHSISKLKQKSLFIELEAKNEQINEVLKEIAALKAEYANQLSIRKADSQEVSEQLVLIKRHAEEISKLLNQAAGENGQLTQIVKDQNDYRDETKSHLSAISDIQNKLSDFQNEVKEKLHNAQSILEYITDKKEIVNKLAGTAGAGVLGQKFEARKVQLAWSSRYWLVGTILSVVAGGAWIGYAHSHFIKDGGELWKTIALNFGILVPAVFLIGFFARQFGRIRHFEEEYAFRSSVAMTASAFADLINADPEKHNTLITETVEKLYKLPVLLQERDNSGWLSQRGTERMVKATTELITAVKKP
jgi:hypothetical protein